MCYTTAYSFTMFSLKTEFFGDFSSNKSLEACQVKFIYSYNDLKLAMIFRPFKVRKLLMEFQ